MSDMLSVFTMKSQAGTDGMYRERDLIILNLGARKGWVVKSLAGRFTPGEKDQVPDIQEAR
jgi:hypothetical protein